MPALLFSCATTLFFGIFAIYLSIREENSRKEFLLQNEIQKKNREEATIAIAKLENDITTEKNTVTSLLNNLPDAIFMIDAHERITLLSQNVRNVLAIQSNSPTLTDLITTFPLHFDFRVKISQVIQENKRIEEKEVIIGKKIMNVIMTPIPNSESMIGVAVILHDVTLEKEVKRLKEEFTSEIVRELHSPLTAIHTGSELMIDKNEHIDTEQGKQLLEIIHVQSKRMIGDIQSLLDAAKIESGHFPIYQKLEDVGKVAQEAVALFEKEAEKKKISLSLHIEPHIPEGLFDEIRITQVLSNLLSNSLTYTPEGGKIVIQAKKSFHQQLPTSPTNPGIIISVSDNGIGIPPEKQAQLFSNFARHENIGHVDNKETTGLGLYITKGIVEAHGGKIFLESMPNKGTTVSFTLPIAKEVNNVQNHQPHLPVLKMVN